jgi:hypothetical protein
MNSDRQLEAQVAAHLVEGLVCDGRDTVKRRRMKPKSQQTEKQQGKNKIDS